MKRRTVNTIVEFSLWFTITLSFFIMFFSYLAWQHYWQGVYGPTSFGLVIGSALSEWAMLFGILLIVVNALVLWSVYHFEA